MAIVEAGVDYTAVTGAGFGADSRMLLDEKGGC